MNNSSDPVEVLVASHGGRLQRAHVEYESAWLALRQTKITLEFVHWLDQKAHLQHKEWRNSSIGIEFDLIANSHINAFATANESIEVVGINAGLIIFLQNVFWAIMSSNQFLQTFGSANTEKNTPRDVGDYISKTNMTDGWGHMAPYDPERLLLAAELSRIAELFVFDHEVAHLTYGHVWHKRLLENRGVGIIFEYGSAYSAEQFRLVQALEFDADEGATAKSINLILATLEQTPFILKNRSRYERLYLWTIAIAILFRVLDLFTQSTDAHVKSTHPAPGVRTYHIIYCALQWIGTTFADELNAFKLAHQLALKEVADLWNAMGLPALSHDFELAKQYHLARSVRDDLLRYDKSELDNLFQERNAKTKVRLDSFHLKSPDLVLK